MRQVSPGWIGLWSESSRSVVPGRELLNSLDFLENRCFVQRHVLGAKPYAGRNFCSLVNRRSADFPPNFGWPVRLSRAPLFTVSPNWLSRSFGSWRAENPTQL